MIYCLDTDILIEYFRGNNVVKNKIESLSEHDNIGITWFSFYEFFKGIFISGKLEEESFLNALLDYTVILEASYYSSKIGGDIYAAF